MSFFRLRRVRVKLRRPCKVISRVHYRSISEIQKIYYAQLSFVNQTLLIKIEHIGSPTHIFYSEKTGVTQLKLSQTLLISRSLTIFPSCKGSLSINTIREWNNRFKFRYEIENESVSKMHLVRSFGIKWHKKNKVVKPIIKSDIKKQLHRSGNILKETLLTHIKNKSF